MFCAQCFQGFLEVCEKVGSLRYCPECHLDLPVFPLNINWLARPRGVTELLNAMNKSEKCLNCTKNVHICCIDCKVAVCEDCAGLHSQDFPFHLLVNYEDYKKNYCFHHVLRKTYHSPASHLLLCPACIVLHPEETFLKLPASSPQYESCKAFLLSTFPESAIVSQLFEQNNPLKILQYFFKLFTCKTSKNLPKNTRNKEIHSIERNGTSVNFYSENAKKINEISIEMKILRWAASTELENGDVLITGGKNDKDKGSSNMFCLVHKVSRCFIRGEMLFGHSSHPAVLAPGENVYILGGKDHKNLSNTHCEVFNCSSLSCRKIASMVVGRTCAAGVYCLGNIYVLGGFSSSFTNSIEKYFISEDFWTLLVVTLPVKLFQPGAVLVDDGQILVYGGEISSENKNCKSFIFNTRTEAFGLCRNMKIKDYFLGFWYYPKVIDSKVMTLNTKNLMKFDLKSTRWDRIKLEI